MKNFGDKKALGSFGAQGWSGGEVYSRSYQPGSPMVSMSHTFLKAWPKRLCRQRR